MPNFSDPSVLAITIAGLIAPFLAVAYRALKADAEEIGWSEIFIALGLSYFALGVTGTIPWLPTGKFDVFFTNLLDSASRVLALALVVYKVFSGRIIPAVQKLGRAFAHR